MDNRPIIAKIMGGLGNQCFQYAFAKALALKNNRPLLLDLSYFNNSSERELALGLFNIHLERADEKLIETYKTKHKSLLQKIGRALRLSKPLWINEYKNKKEHFFDTSLLSLKEGVYLEGYWQAYPYMDFAKSTIDSIYRPVLEKKAASDPLLQPILNKESIALHIRRGDFETNSAYASIHGVLPLSYYYKAIERCIQQSPNAHLFIFSDDPSWVQSEFKTTVPKTLVDLQPGNSGALRDLALMSSCKHFIIANSSFSWWGAYLGKAHNKAVWYPAKWYANKTQPKGFFPENWQLVAIA